MATYSVIIEKPLEPGQKKKRRRKVKVHAPSITDAERQVEDGLDTGETVIGCEREWGVEYDVVG